jgi:broad specificity phosphatase PhoE
MSSTVLWLARHGETVWTVEDRFNGWSDVSLTNEGRRQAEGLANWLRTRPIVAVYSSPLSRCLVTAKIVGSLHNIAPEENLQLKELNYGVWDGMMRPNIAMEYPAEWDAWVNDPVNQAPPDGESGYDVLQGLSLMILLSDIMVRRCSL